MYTIQLIDLNTRKQYMFNFTENVSIKYILNYVSDYFQYENIKYFYKSKNIFNENIYVKDIDAEIYFYI